MSRCENLRRSIGSFAEPAWSAIKPSDIYLAAGVAAEKALPPDSRSLIERHDVLLEAWRKAERPIPVPVEISNVESAIMADPLAIIAFDLRLKGIVLSREEYLAANAQNDEGGGDSLQPAGSARQPTEDESLGMTWWNGCTKEERIHLLLQTEEHTGPMECSPAAAWKLWKEGQIAMGNPPGSANCPNNKTPES